MALTFRKLHPYFVAEVGPVDLRQIHDPETLAKIRAAMDEYAVLVFHDQPFTDDEHLAFAQRLDGLLHTKPGSSALMKNRFGNEALGDISNLDENGEVMKSDNRRRMYGLGNRLWHTDASFGRSPARCAGRCTSRRTRRRSSTGRPRTGGSSCGISSSMRPGRSSSTAIPGASETSSSGTTAPRCTARGRSTTRSIAASSAA